MRRNLSRTLDLKFNSRSFRHESETVPDYNRSGLVPNQRSLENFGEKVWKRKRKVRRRGGRGVGEWDEEDIHKGGRMMEW